MATDGSTIQDVFQTAVNHPSDYLHIGLTYAFSKEEKFKEYLAHAVAVYKGRMYQTIAQFQSPSSPYKLLSSFRIEDAPIFCGRASASIHCEMAPVDCRDDENSTVIMYC